MKFSKLHGCGNDYVLIEALKKKVNKPAVLAKAMCRRRFGVGADGLLMVCPSEKADFRMRMFNPDGTEAEMCGNGIRCFAKYVYDRGLSKSEKLRVETLSGVLDLDLHVEDGRVCFVTVMMGEPVLERAKIPVAGGGKQMINEPVQAAGSTFNVTAVSMGNPHAIVFVDSLADFPVETYGPVFEEHPAFPKKINTSVAEVVSRGGVRVRTWERGAGLTMACGTGCAAVCVAGVLLDKTDRKIHAIVDGGELDLEWREDYRVYLTGPAVEVFSGEYNPG